MCRCSNSHLTHLYTYLNVDLRNVQDVFRVSRILLFRLKYHGVVPGIVWPLALFMALRPFVLIVRPGFQSPVRYSFSFLFDICRRQARLFQIILTVKPIEHVSCSGQCCVNSTGGTTISCATVTMRSTGLATVSGPNGPRIEGSMPAECMAIGI